MPVSIRRRKFS